ncbi:MAG: hypothetical protein R3F17_16275, partial [Planctomycetota bacterium]
TGEGVLEYEVPVGVHSSPWLTLDATRLTQRVPNSDLALEVVFESGMDREATGQGLVFEQDDQTWARFDFAFNANKLQIFGGTFAGGVLQNMHTTNLQTGAWLDGETLAMRVTRTGNQFVQQYSLQGGPWTTAATFNLPMELNYAGIMLASEGDPSEGIVSRIDSIQNLASPLVNEDGTLATDATGPYPYVAEALHLGDGLVRLAWSTDEPANAVLHYGPTPAMAEGSIDFATDAFQHEWWLGGLELDSQYSFQIESFDALGNRSTKDLIVDVPAEAPLGSPAIALWSQSQTVQGITTVRFGDLGFAQPQINLLGNVSDDDEDRLIQHVTLEYQLDGGAWLPLAMGDDRTISYAPWRLANEGDYNVELMLADLMQGTPVGGLFVHDVLLRAQDDEGHTAYRLLRVEVVDGATWDPSASVDWSAILAGGGGPEQGVQIVDGRWHVENVPGIGAALRTDPAHLGYDRLVAIGQGTGASAWENYEATLDATILALDPQGYDRHRVLRLRLRDALDRPHLGGQLRPAEPQHLPAGRRVPVPLVRRPRALGTVDRL